MYVLQPNATKVSVLALNAPGQATSLQSIDIAGPASKVGLAIGMPLIFLLVSPNPDQAQFLYVDPNNLQGMTSFIRN
jgi:hypothetical protein